MIICAAIKLKSGIVASLPRPHRHPDIILGLQANGIKGFGFGEMGFLDHDGMFLNRERALRHLINIDYPVRPSIPGKLYSEDLW